MKILLLVSFLATLLVPQQKPQPHKPKKATATKVITSINYIHAGADQTVITVFYVDGTHEVATAPKGTTIARSSIDIPNRLLTLYFTDRTSVTYPK